LIARLERVSREFFALSQGEKDHISMDMGGRAWRGYFRVGTELTSGLPDQKEGLYFGQQIHWSSFGFFTTPRSRIRNCGELGNIPITGC
jgi:isopenicillin N synthase-like dioxygenase